MGFEKITVITDEENWEEDKEKQNNYIFIKTSRENPYLKKCETGIYLFLTSTFSKLLGVYTVRSVTKCNS